MTTRRDFLCFVVCATPVVSALAQSANKIPRIGILAASDPALNPHQVAAFERGLRDLGYVVGKNILLETRWTGERPERIDDLIRELLAAKVDILVMSNQRAALPAKRATSSVPIILIGIAGDPVADGFVQSLSKPGGNVTGFAASAPELGAKRLELAKELLPYARRMAFLEPNPTVPTLKQSEAAAARLGIELQVLKAQTLGELESELKAATKSGCQALIVARTNFAFINRARIAAIALSNRMPLIGAYEDLADLGALVSYDVSRVDLWRQAARYIDKILRGAKPGDLPVELPTKFEFAVNMKTARTLSVKIPQSILLRADKVIE